MLGVTKCVTPLLKLMLDASSAQEPLLIACTACAYSIESLRCSLRLSASRLLNLSARQASSFSWRVIFFSCASTVAMPAVSRNVTRMRSLVVTFCANLVAGFLFIRFIIQKAVWFIIEQM